MLGIVTPPIPQTFIQLSIIARFINKINPYFQKFLLFFKKTLQNPVKSFFRQEKTGVVKISTKKKVGNSQREGILGYVNERCIFSCKKPVEKGCGKVCGKCGKVLDFHRETGDFPIDTPEKWLHNFLHISWHNGFATVLRNHENQETV